MNHKPIRRGSGILACTCGEIFEWDYERADHMLRNKSDLKYIWGPDGLAKVEEKNEI